MFLFKKSTLWAIAILVTLTACGGGGSDDDSDPAAVTAFSELNADIFTDDTYTDAEVSVDVNGDFIVRTKLAILFTPSATKEEVDTLLTRISATIYSVHCRSAQVSLFVFPIQE